MTQITEQKKELSKKAKESLTTAYMKLYNTLVAAYSTQNITNGRSWFYALAHMRKYLDFHKSEKTNPAVKFLFDFYNTHKKTEAKKMMVSESRNQKKSTCKLPDSFLQPVGLALIDLENQIRELSQEPQVLVTLKLQPSEFFGFYDFASTDPEAEKIDADGRGFEKMYNKYSRIFLRAMQKRINQKK